MSGMSGSGAGGVAGLVAGAGLETVTGWRRAPGAGLEQLPAGAGLVAAAGSGYAASSSGAG